MIHLCAFVLTLGALLKFTRGATRIVLIVLLVLGAIIVIL